MSGPAPTATAIKIMEGNRGHRPLRAAIPVNTGVPIVPSWLRGEARRLWKRLLPELQHGGLIGRVDEIGLASLCQTWAALVAADRALADPAHRDDVRLQRTSNQLRGLLLPQLREYGLTPASRSRLVAPASPASDDMDGLLQ